MKIVLDIQTNGEVNENDVIVWKNGHWTVVSKESFLAKITEKHNKDISSMTKSIEELQRDMVSLAKIVKEK